MFKRRRASAGFLQEMYPRETGRILIEIREIHRLHDAPIIIPDAPALLVILNLFKHWCMFGRDALRDYMCTLLFPYHHGFVILEEMGPYRTR